MICASDSCCTYLFVPLSITSNSRAFKDDWSSLIFVGIHDNLQHLLSSKQWFHQCDSTFPITPTKNQQHSYLWPLCKKLWNHTHFTRFSQRLTSHVSQNQNPKLLMPTVCASHISCILQEVNEKEIIYIEWWWIWDMMKIRVCCNNVFIG